MPTNRRNWLRQIGLATVGLGLAPFKDLALSPTDILPSDDKLIRLSSNENPYGPSPLARAAMADSINISNRYSWQLTTDLIDAIAKKNNVTANNILIGAGSTEIIDQVVRSFAFQKGNIIVADPSFTGWTKAAEKLGLKKIAVPLTTDKRHDLPAMLAAIDADTKMIYICDPNNPTGTVCDRGELVSFINEATKKATVLVDEAYIDLTDQRSVSDLAVENKNLIVAKTFSKIYGLAGARIGYAIGNADTLDKIAHLQSWPNGAVSVVSRVAAIASLKDIDFVKDCYAKNEAVRKYTIEQLTQLNIPCIPSHTNFIYFSLANYTKRFFERLKTNNIQGTSIFEENGRWTRITVGTMDEMQKFIAAIK